MLLPLSPLPAIFLERNLTNSTKVVTKFQLRQREGWAWQIQLRAPDFNAKPLLWMLTPTMTDRSSVARKLFCSYTVRTCWFFSTLARRCVHHGSHPASARVVPCLYQPTLHATTRSATRRGHRSAPACCKRNAIRIHDQCEMRSCPISVRTSARGRRLAYMVATYHRSLFSSDTKKPWKHEVTAPPTTTVNKI